MKILFLNLWHGKLKDELRAFLQTRSDVDIFCFQEMNGAEAALPEFFSSYTCQTVTKDISEDTKYAQAIYAHSRYRIERVAELLQEDPETGFALAVTFTSGDSRAWTVINMYGVPRAYVSGQPVEHDEKSDFPARIRQSKELVAFIETQSGNVVIGGDFNVFPDTESLEMLRRLGLRDLIREYAVPTTRNHLNWDKYPGSPYFFSDYVFTSPEIVVKNFSVPDVEVSDHLPMILEIE